MGLDANIPLHIDKQGIDENALKSAFDNTVGSGRVYLYDHFGSLATTTSSTKSDTLPKVVVLAGLSSTTSALLFLALTMVMNARL